MHKVACLSFLVEEVVDMAEADHMAADPHVHHSCPTINAIMGQCTPTLLRGMPIEMYVFLVVLMWRMDIHPKHALQPGSMSTIWRGSLNLCKSVHLCGVWCVHKCYAQEPISFELTMWGRAGRQGMFKIIWLLFSYLVPHPKYSCQWWQWH